MILAIYHVKDYTRTCEGKYMASMENGEREEWLQNFGQNLGYRRGLLRFWPVFANYGHWWNIGWILEDLWWIINGLLYMELYQNYILEGIYYWWFILITGL
jgi:hypothetical protein